MRKKNKLTQEQLADKLNLNVRQISRIESGVSFITAKSIEKLCEILNIVPADLFRDEIEQHHMQEKK